MNQLISKPLFGMLLCGLLPLASADEEPAPIVPEPESVTMDPYASSGETCDGCSECIDAYDYAPCDNGVVVMRRRLGHHCGNAHAAFCRGMCCTAGYHCGPLIDPWASADWRAQLEANRRSWHAGYYHSGWGAPVALVVPPTSRMQTRWGWGVAQSTMSPLWHQFDRPYPGNVAGGASGAAPMALRPTPRWPSHTDQFGVYSVRGPW
jgi:hypothetical protein